MISHVVLDCFVLYFEQIDSIGFGKDYLQVDDSDWRRRDRNDCRLLFDSMSADSRYQLKRQKTEVANCKYANGNDRKVEYVVDDLPDINQFYTQNAEMRYVVCNWNEE